MLRSIGLVPSRLQAAVVGTITKVEYIAADFLVFLFPHITTQFRLLELCHRASDGSRKLDVTLGPSGMPGPLSTGNYFPERHGVRGGAVGGAGSRGTFCVAFL